MRRVIIFPDKEKEDNRTPEEKKKYPFSKVLLIQESILVWLVTIACLVMAFICIFTGSFVELPWITAMVGCPWAAMQLLNKHTIRNLLRKIAVVELFMMVYLVLLILRKMPQKAQQKSL